MRDTLLAAASPVSHLRSLPNIHAATTVRRVLELVTQLPGPLYDHLVKHPFDLATAKLFGQKAVSREDALL
ncbi:hypothetical protein H4R34_005972 [Dimargaris verticillata]|uniref:Uncharacterized protein n=1 Tax=Dimargaris verticillata TaxID=2761393 RepID=A0A9W8B187_9FUNG|nr:hypothetical protein H4R34_005972 [Dimargaris verticillata]